MNNSGLERVQIKKNLRGFHWTSLKPSMKEELIAL